MAKPPCFVRTIHTEGCRRHGEMLPQAFAHEEIPMVREANLENASYWASVIWEGAGVVIVKLTLCLVGIGVALNMATNRSKLPTNCICMFSFEESWKLWFRAKNRECRAGLHQRFESEEFRAWMGNKKRGDTCEAKSFEETGASRRSKKEKAWIQLGAETDASSTLAESTWQSDRHSGGIHRNCHARSVR